MKMTEQVGTVVTSGNFVPNQFRIKASRKAFEILSAGLYSDKVRAIIRELSTNAADAHIAAGKSDQPFVVHLPNHMEPWFAVTDYGIGLSDDSVLNVYTTYFESNKTDSNDFTGCLGLGSKSPFSYTDSFTVESRHGGMKRVYSAYLSEDGMPSITKMTEEPTDEQNGLTVRFPVKSGDFYAFQSKAQETLCWFKVRPKVTGWSGFAYPDKDFLRKTEKYGVYKHREGRSYVVMGNVAYPIEDREFLTGYESDTGKLRNLVQWGVELYVKVGDCDISASREKLGYDKRTIHHLRTALREALSDLEKEVTKDIGSKPNIWEARVALHEVRQSFQGFDFVAQWNGKPLFDFVKVGVKEVEIPQEDGTVKTVDRPVATVEAMKLKSRNSDRIVVKKDRADTIYADGSKIFLNDDRGAYAGVRRWLGDKSSYSERIYVISDYSQEWLDETGLDKVAVKASTLPKPPRQVGARGSSQKAKLYQFTPTGKSSNTGSNAAGYWTPAEVEIDDGGVYVEILYFNFRMKEGTPTAHPADLNRPLALLKALGKETKLYGIRPSDKALLDKSEGEWRTLKEYVTEVIGELETVHHNDLIQARNLQEIVGGYYRKVVPFENFAACKFSPDSQMGSFVRTALSAKRALEDPAVKAYGDLRGWAQLEPIKDEDVGRLSEAQEALWTKYPLLQYVDPYRRGDEFAEHAAAYVNLIDGQDDAKSAAA